MASTHCPCHALINPSCFRVSHLSPAFFRSLQNKCPIMENKSTPAPLQTSKPPSVMKLSETSFPLTVDQPINLRILLHAASAHQMSSTRLRKVNCAPLQTIAIKTRQLLPQGQPRGYPPPSNAMLFDDDPGIMSEVETSSTGFRRGGKQRSSLPVVRTPSKTLERPLGW